MNQYIITEEELAEMVCDFYNGFFSAGSDIATTVRSHPYQSERDTVLDRLDKEIHIREDEMNRKAGLEENLVTMSGYYASAGALNWVRKVLIDGSRETIRQAGELNVQSL